MVKNPLSASFVIWVKFFLSLNVFEKLVIVFYLPLTFIFYSILTLLKVSRVSQRLPLPHSWNTFLDFRIQTPWRSLPDSHEATTWFHVSSAGEWEQLLPLLETLKSPFIVTYYSPSVLPFIHKTSFCHFPLPKESFFLYKEIIKKFKVSQCIFIKYDFWPLMFLSLRFLKVPIHLLFALHKKKNPISEAFNEYFLNFFQKIFILKEEDRSYFSNFSQEVLLIKDTKWNRSLQRKNSKEDNLTVIAIKDLLKSIHLPILIFGSPHAEEEEIALWCIKNYSHKVFCLVVPHDPKKISSKLTDALPLYSQHKVQPNPLKGLIVDEIGVLFGLYSVAKLSIIGGGFDGYLHNVLESSVQGVCPIFGNNLSRTPEAVILKDHKACLTFSDTDSMKTFLFRWIGGEADSQMEMIHQNGQALWGSLEEVSQSIIF